MDTKHLRSGKTNEAHASQAWASLLKEAEKVLAEVQTADGERLAGVRLFDVYQGESIPAGKKSLAFALTYQAFDRTLTDKEVDKAHKKIEDRLKHVLNAQIRGQ